MRFTETPIPGAYLIGIVPRIDERGLFARTVCTGEFQEHGLNGKMVQQSVSWNPRKGTLRGLHFQATPHGEEKLVRVTRGAIFDVIVDLRPDSPMYGKHLGTELTADNRRQLYIPKGVAHGFQTLEDKSEVFYEMSVAYDRDTSKGIRWNDTTLNIKWPYPELIADGGHISPADRYWPPFSSSRDES